MTASPRDISGAPVASVEAEQGILGAVICNNSALPSLRARIRDEYFSEPLHQVIWKTICALDDDGRAILPATLLGYLPGQIDGLGISTAQYVARLAGAAAGGAVLDSYVKTAISFSGRREIIAVCSDVSTWASDPAPSISASKIAEELSARAQAVIDAYAPSGTSLRAGDAADAVLDRMNRTMRGDLVVETFPTGLVDLDHALGGGLGAGALVTIAGRPAMGKTVTGVSLAMGVAERGSGVVFISLELPMVEITARFMSYVAREGREPVSFQDIPNAINMTEGRFRAAMDAGARLRQLPLVIDAASSVSVAMVKAKVRAQKAIMARDGKRLSVIIIDYLKFIEATDRYKGQRVYEVAEITRGLKQLAKDEGVAVVLLAQLNRGVENREDKRPGLADLRESGDIESDSDVVAFVYREAYYIKKSPEYRAGNPASEDAYEACKRAGELIVAKNRNGPEMTVRLYAEIENSYFASAARSHWGANP